MILGFKTKFHWGELTFFEHKIIQSAAIGKIVFPIWGFFKPKLHTIREGFRIKPGDTLHMATGVRTKFYNQFNKGIPGLEKCISVQSVRIFADVKEVWIENHNSKPIKECKHFREGSRDLIFRKLTGEEFETFVRNDGFDSVEQFWKWFTKDCVGQIIFWVDIKY